MGDLNKYFSRSEFSCHCQPPCGFNAVDTKLLEVLTKIREMFGAVNMHCACRCKAKNDEVGSRDTSQHLRGLAADFSIKDANVDNVISYANELLGDNGGFGVYPTFFHIDVREKKARWDHRS